MNLTKKIRVSSYSYNNDEEMIQPFEKLPDDLVIYILSKICSSSSCPSDFITALTVCKRFNELGTNKLVLSRASCKLFGIKAKNWCESAHRFLKLCVNAGSIEAFYFLGMVRFYCLGNKVGGVWLMEKAAIKSHAAALYSLAVIQFNGSGGSKSDKDLTAGVALCARAAYLGHVDALRELGHCLQDGYGVKQNITKGKRLLIQANARELASVFHKLNITSSQKKLPSCVFGSGVWSFLSDFGLDVPAMEPHPVNRFLVEWFKVRASDLGSDVTLCSHTGCGRPEKRPHEFRKCSLCGAAKYCSRGCQALDWKFRHKVECTPVEPPNGGGPQNANVDVQPLDNHEVEG